MLVFKMVNQQPQQPPTTPTSSRHATPVVPTPVVTDGSIKLPIKVLADLIPQFDKKRENLTQFIENANLALNLATEEQQNTLLTIIVCRISGPARKTLKHRTFLTWDDLKQFLMDTYSDKRAAASYQIQLVRSKQGPSETAVQFGRRIENILGDLILTLPDSAEDELEVLVKHTRQQALDAFTNGLQPRLSIIIKSLKPKSLEEAIGLAVAEEKLLNQQKDGRPTAPTSTQRKCFKCQKPGHLAANCRSGSPKFASVRAFDADPIPTAAVNFCKYCKKKNHTIDECRKREERNRKSPPSKCNFCQNLGHDESRCRKKKAATQQSSQQPPQQGTLNWS